MEHRRSPMNDDKIDSALNAEKIAEQFLECLKPGLVKLISSLSPAAGAGADVPALVDARPELQAINAKDNLSTNEAAALLGVSASHIRNLVERARKKQAPVPIPFQDLDGILRFPRVDLIEWRDKPKPRAAKGGKQKPQLSAVS